MATLGKYCSFVTGGFLPMRDADTDEKGLDEILQGNRSEIDRLRDILVSVTDNVEHQFTSWSTKIVPASAELLAWLNLFEQNMLPEYATRVKVCFAERGFSILLKLLDGIDEEIRLENLEPPTPEDAMEIEDSAAAFRDQVLGARHVVTRNSIPMMRVWFSTLIDLVPLEYRSPLTPFTTENKKRIN
jgi:hypothetical protein